MINSALSALHVAAIIIAVGLMISSTACSSRSAPRVRLLGGASSRSSETTSVVIPSSIAVARTCHVEGADGRTPAPCGRLHLAVCGEGHQHYAFNGTHWALFNATADLTPAAVNISSYTSNDGKDNFSSINAMLQYDHRKHVHHYQVIGEHFFLAHPDAAGGQPTWRITLQETDGSSSGLVTAKTLRAVSVDPNSITWNLLQTTARSGSPDSLGDVTYVQRIATRGGLPPSTTSSARTGDIYLSPYSAIYAFYVPPSS